MPHWYQYIPSLIQFCFGFAPHPWIYNALMVSTWERLENRMTQYDISTYIYIQSYLHTWNLRGSVVFVLKEIDRNTSPHLFTSLWGFTFTQVTMIRACGTYGNAYEDLIPCCDWVQPLFSPQVIWVMILWWGAKAVDPNPVFNSLSNLCANRRELCIAWMTCALGFGAKRIQRSVYGPSSRDHGGPQCKRSSMTMPAVAMTFNAANALVWAPTIRLSE